MGIHARRKRRLFNNPNKSRPKDYNKPVSFMDGPSNKFRKYDKSGKFNKHSKHDENPDESISSNSYDDESITSHSSQESSQHSIEETVEEKKIRLAQSYLKQIEKEEQEMTDESNMSSEEDEDLKEKITQRLMKDRLKKEGKLYTSYIKDVNDYLGVNEADVDDLCIMKKGHSLTPTCLSLKEDLFSGSKDGGVLQWDVERQSLKRVIVQEWYKGRVWNEKKQTYNPNRKVINDTRNNGQVLSVSGSDCGRYVVVGWRDGKVRVFDLRLSDGAVVNEGKLGWYCVFTLSKFLAASSDVVTVINLQFSC